MLAAGYAITQGMTVDDLADTWVRHLTMSEAPGVPEHGELRESPQDERRHDERPCQRGVRRNGQEREPERDAAGDEDRHHTQNHLGGHRLGTGAAPHEPTDHDDTGDTLRAARVRNPSWTASPRRPSIAPSMRFEARRSAAVAR